MQNYCKIVKNRLNMIISGMEKNAAAIHICISFFRCNNVSPSHLEKLVTILLYLCKQQLVLAKVNTGLCRSQ